MKHNLPFKSLAAVLGVAACYAFMFLFVGRIGETPELEYDPVDTTAFEITTVAQTTTEETTTAYTHRTWWKAEAGDYTSEVMTGEGELSSELNNARELLARGEYFPAADANRDGDEVTVVETEAEVTVTEAASNPVSSEAVTTAKAPAVAAPAVTTAATTAKTTAATTPAVTTAATTAKTTAVTTPAVTTAATTAKTTAVTTPAVTTTATTAKTTAATTPAVTTAAATAKTTAATTPAVTTAATTAKITAATTPAVTTVATTTAMTTSATTPSVTTTAATVKTEAETTAATTAVSTAATTAVSTTVAETVVTEADEDPEPQPDNKSEILRVKINGKAYECDADDIIARIVMKEMGSSFETEAIKAQAVAVYSYIKYYHSVGSTPNFVYSSFSFSSAIPAKVKNAVAEVRGIACYYGGGYANTTFYASSGGCTASSKDIWSANLGYLTSVECEFDAKYDRYYGVTKTMSEDKVRSSIEKKYGITLSNDPSNWISVSRMGDGGYIARVDIDGQKVEKGNDFRTCLGLNSAKFEVEYIDGEFIFTTYGYGHGVGLSQNGANHYALYAGYDYVDILEHYYPGVTVK